MKRAIKIEDLPALDDTARDVLRVIALHLGERESAFVNYNLIAKSIGTKRNVVASAIERLKKKRVVKVVNGELTILNSTLI